MRSWSVAETVGSTCPSRLLRLLNNYCVASPHYSKQDVESTVDMARSVRPETYLAVESFVVSSVFNFNIYFRMNDWDSSVDISS